MLIKPNTTIGNYSYNMVATSWEAVTDVVLMAIIARYLDLSLFGHYAFVMAFVASFKVLCGISLPVIITREIAVHKEQTPQLLAASLIIQGIMSLFTFFLIMAIMHFIDHDPLVIRATFFATLAVIFDFFGLMLVSVARGFERMEYAAYRIIIVQTLFLGATFILVHLAENRLLPIFVIYLSSHVVGCAYAVYVVFTKFAKPTGPIDKKLCKYLFLEAFPIAVRRFVRHVNFRIDTILLNFLRGSVAAGLFHGAYKISQGLMFFGEALVVSVFPVLSRHYVQAKESLDKVYERSFRFLAISGCFLGVILFTFSRELILLALGRKYLGAENVLRVFGSIIVFMFMAKLAERMLIVAQKQVLVTVIAVIALVINVVFDLVLIPRWGIVGASLATLSAEIVLFVLGLYYTYKHVSEMPVHRCMLKVLFVYTTTCVLITLSDVYLGRVTGFFGGPAVYVSGILLLRLAPMAELSEIKNRLLKAVRWQTGHRGGMVGPGTPGTRHEP